MNIDSYIYRGRGTLPLGRNQSPSNHLLRNESSDYCLQNQSPSNHLLRNDTSDYCLQNQSPSNHLPRYESSNHFAFSQNQSPRDPQRQSTINHFNSSQNQSPITQSNQRLLQSPPPRVRASKRSLIRIISGFVKQRRHVVLLGLNGSGKTTILMRLKYRCRITTAPTIGFNHEKVWGGGFRWSAWDVGGGEKFRPLWVMYSRATDGIIFVVNSSASPDVMEEARVELTRVIKSSKVTASDLRGASPPPVLVLANFQDKPYSRNAEEVASALGLSEPWACGVLWGVAPVCGLNGEGLDSALCTLRTLIDGNQSRERRSNIWR